MSNQSVTEKLAKHRNIIEKALEDLRKVLILIVNERADISELVPEIEKLRNVRQVINNSENIGFALGFMDWRVAGFPLSGDAEKDLNQLQTKIPKNKIN